MDNNPIMQRVMMLSEMWSSAISENPSVRVFAWVGASSVEYKTIQGFIKYQASHEKTLADTVLSMPQPFDPLNKSYPESIISDMYAFLTEWNKDEGLSESTGKIEWQPLEPATGQPKEEVFLENLSLLAKALAVTGKPEVLAVALLPVSVSDAGEFCGFIEKLIKAGIPDTVRFMLYESQDSLFFETLGKKYTNAFKYLYPDLDIPGAMDQILESAKAQKNNDAEKDIISFQQALIKLNEAIGYGNEENVVFYKDACLAITNRHTLPEQESLVYYFMHTFYSSLSEPVKAAAAINKAIDITDNALSGKTIENYHTAYHYRIAKGNLFFMNKEYKKAAEVYRETLALPRSDSNIMMLAGVHQMLGNSLRQCAGKTEARACFKEGWSLLILEDETMLKENAMAMFYAGNMMDIVDNDILENYAPQWEKLWGHNWQKSIRNGTSELHKN